MDEPTANLDYGNQALILDEIERLRDQGVSVLFSTHHPEQALAIADEAILIRAGAVMVAGPVGEALTSENLSALYGRPLVVADAPGARHRIIYRP